MSVYEELLDWQRRTKVEAGGNIAQVMHRYCRFMSGHGIDRVGIAALVTEIGRPAVSARRDLEVAGDDAHIRGRIPEAEQGGHGAGAPLPAA